MSSTTHPAGTQKLHGLKRRKLSVEDGVPALWVRTNAYGSSTLLRFVGMGAFALALLTPGMTRGLQKPDVVVGSTVHPLAAWAASRLAKRHGVPFVFEVRDVWPDALIELGAVSGRGLTAKAIRRLMRTLAQKADLVLSPLPHLDLWLKEIGLPGKAFCWVSNGVEQGDGVPDPGRNPGKGGFTFMYLGSHGKANVLDSVLDAFDQACSARPDLGLKLRLVGDGPKKPSLQEYANNLSSRGSIRFEDRIPQGEVMARASEADCLVAALADLPTYRHGTSLNKSFMYLASGRPVVWASNAPNNLVREAGSGICVPSEDATALADAMIRMAETPAEERRAMGRRGIRHVEQNYTFEVLGVKLADALDGLLASQFASVADAFTSREHK